MSDKTEWPKWVKVHVAHIFKQKAQEGQLRQGYDNALVIGDSGPDHMSVPAFKDFHVDRATGEVTVLVNNADEEKSALSDPKAETN
jgi:hypothetical protein